MEFVVESVSQRRLRKHFGVDYTLEVKERLVEMNNKMNQSTTPRSYETKGTEPSKWLCCRSRRLTI